MSDVLEIIRNIATDVARGNKDPKALASCIVVLINEVEELKNTIKDYHEQENGMGAVIILKQDVTQNVLITYNVVLNPVNIKRTP